MADKVSLFVDREESIVESILDRRIDGEAVYL